MLFICVCVCVFCLCVYMCLSMCVCALLFGCSQALVRVQRLLQLDAISRGCRSALPCPALLSHLSSSPSSPCSHGSRITQLSGLLLPFSFLSHSTTLLSFSPSLSSSSKRLLVQNLCTSAAVFEQVCMCQCVRVCACICVCVYSCVCFFECTLPIMRTI